MGLLAEGKSRRKISSDPNNTKWTRDTTTFGQKILRSQGWEPGQFLGAKDSSLSELHTAANASYIRVTLKDDMKGLGYNKSKADEVTGLDVFSDLLSRLNGKSTAQVTAEQASRLVVKTHRYVEMKWGPMRFVRGGLLVGDTIKEEEDSSENGSEIKKSAEVSDTRETSPTKDSKKDKSKKRKAESLEDSDSESSDDDVGEKQKKRRKEERKAKKKHSESTPTDASEGEKAEDASLKREKKKEKKEKKMKKMKRSKKDKANASSEGDTTESDEVSETTKSKDEKLELKESKEERKKREKKEKKERKEKRKEKKDKKKRLKQDSESPDTEMSDAVQQTSSASALTTGQSTPASSNPMANRHFVRSRYIAQKKKALMDPAALKQIFMIKA